MDNLLAVGSARTAGGLLEAAPYLWPLLEGATYVSQLPELKKLSNLKISFSTADYLIAMKIRSSVRSRFGYEGDLGITEIPFLRSVPEPAASPTFFLVHLLAGWSFDPWLLL